MADSAEEIAGERQRVDDRVSLGRLRQAVHTSEFSVARRRRLARWRGATAVGASAAVAFGLAWTLVFWGVPARFVRVDIACGTTALVLAVPAIRATVRLRSLLSRRKTEENLETNREALRFLSALAYPPLSERRALYREDVAALVKQHQAESRKYRRIHNSLQSLIMIGSAATTLIAALDAGQELTWQSVTLTVISFAITLASMFTGYYKFRERSYFLQQTADAIEEEASAVALGVGPYHAFTPGQEAQALALFTQRVEDLRNEQRRRQQQFDQPTEQGGPAGQPQP
ncbi:DUF4231 domain-containing protein [Kitasatospora indigofera]|uniref:DUF4231 domain-containing protein n=1 Tax=Kitasatospora indigofera TaxID=67307 RepID=UPI00369C05E8